MEAVLVDLNPVRDSRSINLRGIVFAGGEGPSPEALREIARGADVLAAADSGLIIMEEAGLRPHWIVGDMDSLACETSRACGTNRSDPDRLDKYPVEIILRFPMDKDLTDTELALNLLKEKGCTEIWIAGGGGGRIDHLFAIRDLFEREECPDRWFPGKEEVRCLKAGEFLNKTLPEASLVSVFPVGEGPWQAESSGLKWPLAGLAWKKGNFGLSNVASGGSFEIRSVRGRFLVVMPIYFDK